MVHSRLFDRQVADYFKGDLALAEERLTGLTLAICRRPEWYPLVDNENRLATYELTPPHGKIGVIYVGGSQDHQLEMRGFINFSEYVAAAA